MNNTKKNDNRSATQRLGDLENAVMSLYNVLDNLTRDFMVLKDALKLLDNKVNSIVKASTNNEPLTDEVLDRIMVENNVAELTQKVNNMVLQKIVAPETQVSENSFVVGSESDNDGKVVNPRLQFALKALAPEVQEKIKGVSVGDTVNFEGKLNFKVLESYTILPPPASESAFEGPTAETPTDVVVDETLTDQAVTSVS